MKKSIFLILGVLSVLFVFAQNSSQTDKAKGQKDLNLPKLIPQIPNPSFEDTLCEPTTFSQMSCCDYWVQASFATSDYFNVHNYMPSGVPLPLPDGNACVGEIFVETWKEYVGVCLPQPLDSGVHYNFTVDIAFEFTNPMLDSVTPSDSISPVNITLFGDTICSGLPFSNYDCCPVGQGYWQALGYVTVNPYDVYGVWHTYTISFTPNQNISAIVLGPPCTLPQDSLYMDVNDSCLPYFFFDNISSSYNSVQLHASNNEFLTVFPNPGDGKFTLNYNIDKKSTALLEVVSLSGQLFVKENINGTSNQKTLDLTNLPDGIYLLRVKTKTQVITKKIVIGKE